MAVGQKRVPRENPIGKRKNSSKPVVPVGVFFLTPVTTAPSITTTQHLRRGLRYAGLVTDDHHFLSVRASSAAREKKKWRWKWVGTPVVFR